MICLICRQAEIIDGFTSVAFERGEIRFEVRSVPAYLCPSCGEAYVDETVAERLLKSGDEMLLTGELVDLQDYESL